MRNRFVLSLALLLAFAGGTAHAQTTIKSENWDGVTAPAIPSGWTATSGLVTSTSQFVSSPNSLEYPIAQQGGTVLQNVWSSATDGNSGNSQCSAKFYLDASATGQINQYVFCRYGPTSSTAYSSASNYAVVTVQGAGGSNGAYLTKQVSGTQTVLAGPVGTFANGIWYYCQVIPNGTSIKGRIQRLDNSQWLNSSGTWVTDGTGQTYFGSVTDSSVTGAGYGGVAFFAPVNSGANGFTDDFLFQSLASGGSLTANTCTATVASSTSVTVSGTAVTGGTATFTYQVQRSPHGANTWSNVGSGQSGVAANTAPTNVTDTGLTSGTIYDYRWSVTDSASANVTSNVVSLAPHAASTFYVSSTGSDSNNGTTSGTAWQTCAHATAFGGIPGDSFLFDGGHPPSDTILFSNVAGTYAAPLTIGVYDGSTCTISAGNSYGVRLNNCSGVIVRNLIISGSGVSSGGVSTNTDAGIEVLNTATSGQLAGIYLDNVQVHDCWAGIDIRGHASGTSGTGSGFTDVRVTNATIYNYNYFALYTRTLPLLDGSGNPIAVSAYSYVTTVLSSSNNFLVFKGQTFNHVYVADSVAYNGYGNSANTALSQQGDGISIRNVGGIQLPYETVCERTVVHDIGGNYGWNNAAIWLQESTYCRIAAVECYNVQTGGGSTIDGDAWDMDGGCTYCVVEQSYAHECDGAGGLCGPYTGGPVPDHCTFRFNVVQNCGRKNSYGAFHPYGGCTNTTIHNNTIRSTTPTNGTTACIVDGGVGSGFGAYNNVFTTASGVALLKGTFSGATFAANCYFANGGSFLINWNSTNYSSFASWQSATSQEVANGSIVGLSVDPKLVNPGGGGARLPSAEVTTLSAYDLLSSSPCINSGLDLKAVYGLPTGPADFHLYPNRFGTSALSSGIDIGAVEYNASSLMPSTGGGGGYSRSRVVGGH